MKLFTPEKIELIDVTSVKPHPDGIEIEGTIMGAMPMKAVLLAKELRSGFRFFSLRLALTILRMLIRGR